MLRLKQTLNWIQEGGVKHLIPDVKEKLAEKEAKITTHVDHFLDKAMDFLPNLISALVVLLVGLWLIKRIGRLADKAMSSRELEYSLRTFLRSLTTIGLRIILIVTVAGMLGIGTTSFVTILGAAGLAVGLALQGSLSNFAGGVLILIFKPFKVGDSIEAGGQSGDVLEIQIFNTILKTAENKTVILPNGPLSNGTIVNVTRRGSVRTELLITVGDENEVSKIISIIESVLSKEELVLKEPAPKVFVQKIEGGNIYFQILPHTLPGKGNAVRSSLYTALLHQFKVNQIIPAKTA